MKDCIICRKETNEFSDEHVIPDSIGGYYHIYSVCKGCNSSLGQNVDSKLVNHKLIEFQRQMLNIKGKSGCVPNPFIGTHKLKDDEEQKIVVKFDENGILTPRLLPKIGDLENIGNKTTISFTLDKKDLHLKEQIVDKILKRNGIDKSRIICDETQREYIEKPWIQTQLQVDIKDFRIGLLKIAYEFTIDTFKDYFDDPLAIVISEILFHADLKRMEEQISFLGDGFNKEILKPLSHLIDFENNNHYLTLLYVKSIGLLCQVNLFNCFSIAIKMSNSNYMQTDNIFLGINDIENKKFEKLTIDELVQRTYSPIEYRFQYYFPNENELLKFMELQNNNYFDFYKTGDVIPFFDKKGNIVYDDIETKLSQTHLVKIPKGDVYNAILTEILLDEELYIKVLPTMDLLHVVSVQIEQYKVRKV